MKLKSLFLISFIFVLLSSGFARPKVALVLSGGGAKGLAEIPLLEAIESEGIKPDMVLGTSMGALIGSLYAAGYSPKQIRETLVDMDYIKVLGEHPVSLERVTPDAFSAKGNFSLAVSFSLKRLKIGSAPGIIGDQNIIMELTNHLSRVLAVDDFDKLSIPFRCIATNVSTGEPMVLKSGSIVDAVRASISLPGIFTPAPLDNGVYAMDGGLRNNLPVQLARDMGADIIIAMDVASSVDTDPATLTDMATVAEQIISLIISSNAVEQYHLANIVLKPDLKKFSTADFFHPAEIVAAGEKCIEENRNAIHELALSISKQGYPLAVQDYDRVSDYNKLPDLKIRKIHIKNVSFTDDSPIPNEKDFAKYEGKILDEKTRNKLTRELKEKKKRYHLSNFNYSVEKIEGSDECDLIIKARYYDHNLNKAFFCANPSLSITNYPSQKWASINPATTTGICLVEPINAMLRFSTRNMITVDGSIFPEFAFFHGFKICGELAGEFKYGSLKPEKYFEFNEKLVDSDRGLVAKAGLLLKYSDMLSFRLGLANETDYLVSDEDWFTNTYAYNEIVFTTLHNSFSGLNGFQLESVFNVGKENRDFSEIKLNSSLHVAFEKRFEIQEEKTSIGFGASFSRNRFPYKLNVGYTDFGGIDGMCGYPLSTLKRDFLLSEISIRRKLFSFMGMPFHLVLLGKVGLSDDYDPFYDEAIPSEKFFGNDRQVEAGGGAYAAFATPLGNLVLGYSINTSNKWVITLALK